MRDAVDVPVIASVNATSSGSWIRYAAMLADAGASAIELNVYAVAADASRSGAELERPTSPSWPTCARRLTSPWP